jgi:hypothetical protein
MKASVKVVDVKDNKLFLRHIQTEQIMVTTDCIISIDGSTTNTGIGILRKVDGALFYSIAAEREDGETRFS